MFPPRPLASSAWYSATARDAASSALSAGAATVGPACCCRGTAHAGRTDSGPTSGAGNHVGAGPAQVSTTDRTTAAAAAEHDGLSVAPAAARSIGSDAAAGAAAASARWASSFAAATSPAASPRAPASRSCCCRAPPHLRRGRTMCAEQTRASAAARADARAQGRGALHGRRCMGDRDGCAALLARVNVAGPTRRDAAAGNAAAPR
eukprot:365612-Chlamydomonas_euryale.AAC.2